MAIWYSVGTVALTNNSTTVTGTGTNFAANVRVGDAFYHNKLTYEVTNVASATVLSIKPAFVGANVSGQAYSIAPIQGYVKEAADRLRSVSILIDGNAQAVGDASAFADAAELSAQNAAASESTVAADRLLAQQAAASATLVGNTVQGVADAALLSETNAKASEVAAKASEVASNASEVASLASQTAAATSETNAAASATQAALSRDTASGSASSAQANAVVATTKASEASTSATNALASENAAALSASNAAASESTASLTGDRLLLPTATNPTTRDDGSALQVGDKYFNTTLQAEFIYKSGGWVINESTGGGTVKSVAGVLPDGVGDVNSTLLTAALGVNGKVQAPSSTVTANSIALFDGTTGKLVKQGPLTSSFATSAQGTKADSALQPSDIGNSVQGKLTPGTNITIDGNTINAVGGFVNPMTAAGDIIVGGVSGAPTRLAKGTDGQSLTVDAGNIVWKTSTASDVDFTIIYPNGGSAGSPANVSINSRHVVTNPFPGFNVMCCAQVLVAGVWEDTGWVATPTIPTQSFGVSATQRQGAGVDTIIVQTGVSGIAAAGTFSGGSYAGASVVAPTPCRVKVWKVKGAVV